MPKYKAAAYIRLSYTDDHSSESDSVSNQRKLIENFVERNPDIEVVSEKIDDGYSGIIFDRPAFKEMMQDVTDGNINCVIVKDLSRLGREYIETGRYLRRVFPAYGVRFIAITDSIDTAHDSGDDLTVSVKNIMNEAYCRDISIKTRSSLDVKRRNGDFVGAFPVYGYMKAEGNKNLLVPDPYAARVVCDIFRMRLEGASASKIASELNRLGILSPLAYKKNNGLPYYITGFLILLSVLLGRFICGFLCPFGWFQELLHKIPTKKLSTKRLKPLTYLKYAVLLVMVFLLPAFLVNDVGMGDPFFCKYLCPQGVLEGAIPLSLANSGVRAALGKLFAWKFSILLSVIALSVLFYRPFCKWLCPLGAFYALFNRVSLFQMKVDKNKCVSCGKCARACKMDVDVTKTPNHTECIRCGMCIRACSTKAVCFRYGFGDGKDKAKAAETLQTNNNNREE